jgi:hypothetical protein
MSKQTADILERTFWAVLSTVVSLVTVDQLNLPKAWVPVAVLVFAALKGLVASRYVGVKGSAATLPPSLDSSAPAEG